MVTTRGPLWDTVAEPRDGDGQWTGGEQANPCPLQRVGHRLTVGAGRQPRRLPLRRRVNRRLGRRRLVLRGRSRHRGRAAPIGQPDEERTGRELRPTHDVADDAIAAPAATVPMAVVKTVIAPASDRPMPVHFRPFGIGPRLAGSSGLARAASPAAAAAMRARGRRRLLRRCPWARTRRTTTTATRVLCSMAMSGPPCAISPGNGSASTSRRRCRGRGTCGGLWPSAACFCQRLRQHLGDRAERRDVQGSRGDRPARSRVPVRARRAAGCRVGRGGSPPAATATGSSVTHSPALTICTSVTRLGRPKAVLAGAGLAAHRERLFAQAVAIVEQKDLRAIERVGGERAAAAQDQMPRRRRDHEGIPAERRDRGRRLLDRAGSPRRARRPATAATSIAVRLRSTDGERGKVARSRGVAIGNRYGHDRRDDAEPQRAAQRIGATAAPVAEIGAATRTRRACATIALARPPSRGRRGELRSNIWTPSCRSACATCALSDGCATWHASAARRNPPDRRRRQGTAADAASRRAGRWQRTCVSAADSSWLSF